MDTKTTYTLAELANEFGLTERTARYYIEKILPPHHKKGRGKVARYGRDTWNCFAFLQLVRDRYGLGPSQVRGVLADIAQETVDRVISGEEELAVMGVPTVPMQSADLAASELPAASQRATRLRTKESREPDKLSSMMAYSVSEDDSLSEPEPLFQEFGADAPTEPDGGWQAIFSDEKLRILHRGDLDLTRFQQEQIAAAAWLIRQAIEQ